MIRARLRCFWRWFTAGCPRLSVAVLMLVVAGALRLYTSTVLAGEPDQVLDARVDQVLWLVFVAALSWVGWELRRLSSMLSDHRERIGRLDERLNTVERTAGARDG